MADTAVVTGAGRGIGREIARRLTTRGYAVLVTDVNENSARETAEELGGEAWAMAQDVREPQSHRAVAEAATARGALKVWVNNAGVLRTAKPWEQDDDEVRLIVDANVLGVMHGSRAAVNAMRQSGGHIVNMASMSSFGPVPGITVYAASKHAVLGFTTSLQGDLDVAGIPIRMHALCPLTVATGMVEENSRGPDAALLFSGPRLLSAAEVADAAVGLLDGKKLVVSIPTMNGWLTRSVGVFPRFGLKLLPLFRRAGARKQPTG